MRWRSLGIAVAMSALQFWGTGAARADSCDGWRALVDGERKVKQSIASDMSESYAGEAGRKWCGAVGRIYPYYKKELAFLQSHPECTTAGALSDDEQRAQSQRLVEIAETRFVPKCRAAGLMR